MSESTYAEPPRRIPKLQVRNRIEGLAPPPPLNGSVDDITAVSEPPRRIPKLQVRNRIEGLPPPPGLVVNPPDDTVHSPTSPTLSLASTLSRPQTSPTPSTDQIPRRRPLPLSQSPRLSFVSRSSMTSPEPPVTAPKKSKSVFGFLSIKEPSTSAWQQFVDEQQQQAGLKGSRTLGFTDKKLPANVPKVNSKWDGMPTNFDRSSTSLDLGSFVKNGSQILSRSTSRKSGDAPKNSANSSRPSSGRPSTGGKSTGSKGLQKEISRSSQRSGSTAPSTVRQSSNSRPAANTRTISDDSLRLGPSMSVDTRSEGSTYVPSPTESMMLLPIDSMPELSLFFPPGYVPRDIVENNRAVEKSHLVESNHAVEHSRGIENNHAVENSRTVENTPTQGGQVEAIRDETPTPRAASPDDRLSQVPSMEDDSSQDQTPSQSDTTSQDSPTTPDLPAAMTLQQNKPRLDTQPRRYLNVDEIPQWPLVTKPEDVVPKHFRTVDEIPQWPLATNPQDVIIESTSTTTKTSTSPPIPSKSLRRSSSSSMERLNATMEKHSSRNTSPSDTPASSSPASPTLDMSVPHMVPQPHSTRPTVSPQHSTRSVYNPWSLRGPPALQPGRVITKDWDLATIPESDTASLRSRNSTYIPSSNTNTNLARGDFADPNSDGNSIAESTASSQGTVTTSTSQMSAQWYMSPRERLGLGGFIKHGTKVAPWPLLGGDEDEVRFAVEGVRELNGGEAQAKSGQVEEKGRRDGVKRNALLGVFKR